MSRGLCACVCETMCNIISKGVSADSQILDEKALDQDDLCLFISKRFHGFEVRVVVKKRL